MLLSKLLVRMSPILFMHKACLLHNKNIFRKVILLSHSENASFMLLANMYKYTDVSIIPQLGDILYMYIKSEDNGNQKCTTVSAFSQNMAECRKQFVI